ncbi:MAG: cytochrome b5 domain-containing protein [Anaerolineae bacterium]
MIKKYVSIAVFIAWGFFVAVLVAGLVFLQNRMPSAGVGLPGGSTTIPNGPAVTLTLDEIAKHGTAADCWLIINNSVYNVTTYLPVHPGNPGTIIPYCGKDGTTAFGDKGRPGGGMHSAFAQALLAQFKLGAVGDTISSSGVNPQVTVPPGGGGEREREFD